MRWSHLQLVILMAFAVAPGARAASPIQDEEPYQVIPVGGDEVVELDFVPEQNSMESAILRLRPGPNGSSLRVIGLSPGKAAFLVHNRAGQIFRKVKFHVIKIEIYQRFSTVKRLLKNVKGVVIHYEGENIVASGNAVSAKDYEKVERVKEAYPEMLNLVDAPE